MAKSTIADDQPPEELRELPTLEELVDELLDELDGVSSGIDDSESVD